MFISPRRYLFLALLLDLLLCVSQAGFFLILKKSAFQSQNVTALLVLRCDHRRNKISESFTNPSTLNFNIKKKMW